MHQGTVNDADISGVDFEHTTCVFAHPKMNGLYFNEDSPQGMTQELSHATKYMGSASRLRGMEILKARFPKISDGQVIFYYFCG